MRCTRACIAATIAAALGVLAPVASGRTTQPVSGRTAFHPRIGPALGLVPPVAGPHKLSPRDVATGALTPVTYHGGLVMAGGVTVHTVFWAPPGHAFQGSPGGGVPTYEGLIQQFFTDIAHDSGAGGACTTGGCNALSVLPQFADGTSVGQITPGAYRISYNASGDSINDTDPYPAKSAQCASPTGIATCVTDAQVRAEIDHLAQSTPGAPRGLTNLWFMFLPPDVDECITAGSCGTNVFAGYHEVSSVGGHGVTIYAVAIDPLIEGAFGPGADPQGYPDAEAAINTAAHETVEAMTDPEGAGWMDPNGNEVGDKCEATLGSPLGFAPDGSPYNQVINGHQYLLQDMWANLDSGGNPGCVQATSDTANQLPLPQVNLRQFNPIVTGNVNRGPGGGIGVRVTLLRIGPSGTPIAVAHASTTTAGDGSWSLSLRPHAPGDDRDEIDVDYSGANAPQPTHQVILTGNGGNPFSEAGWTGWTALNIGSAVQSARSGGTLSLSPCFQAGILSYTFNGPGAQSPTDLCDTQTDAATVGTAPIGRGRRRDGHLQRQPRVRRPDHADAEPAGRAREPDRPRGRAGRRLAVLQPAGAVLHADRRASVPGRPGGPGGRVHRSGPAGDLHDHRRQAATARRRRRHGHGDRAAGRVRRALDHALERLAGPSPSLHVAHLRVLILGEETVIASAAAASPASTSARRRTWCPPRARRGCRRTSSPAAPR